MLKIKSIFTFIITVFAVTAFAGQTPKISQQDLITALENSSSATIILDVRTKKEFDHGHIAGAINLSHNEIEDKIAQLTQYKDKKVVVHCRSGRRAGVAEAILVKHGFSQVLHLTGDMNGWVEAKLPTVGVEK